MNGLAFLFSGVILLVAYRPWEHMPQLDVAAVALLTFMVVVGTFGAYALYLQGVKDAGSMRASLLGTNELLGGGPCGLCAGACDGVSHGIEACDR